MPVECLDDLALAGVPDLELARVRADGQQVTLLRPLDACHCIRRTDVMKFRYLTACC